MSDLSIRLTEMSADLQRTGAIFSEMLEEPMQQEMTFSHRNGETIPPTERGWYWLTHTRSKSFYIPGVPLVFLAKKKYGKVLFVVDLDIPAADIHGRWWGPVTFPWREQSK